MTNNHNIEYILGIQIKRDCSNKILKLTQEKYISNLLLKINIAITYAVATPLEADIYYS